VEMPETALLAAALDALEEWQAAVKAKLAVRPALAELLELDEQSEALPACVPEIAAVKVRDAAGQTHPRQTDRPQMRFRVAEAAAAVTRQTDGQRERQADVQVGRQVGRWRDSQADRHTAMVWRTDRQAHGRMVLLAGREAGGWPGRQPDSFAFGLGA
jgi:hypothetical protein